MHLRESGCAVLWIFFMSGYSVQFYKRVNLLCFGHCLYLVVDSIVVQTLNICIQTFCVLGYKKDHRIRTFHVIRH